MLSLILLLLIKQTSPFKLVIFHGLAKGLINKATLHTLCLISFIQCVISFIQCTDAIKVLEDGDLQTLGMLDYDKRLKHSFTAHPKVDPFTGNVIPLKNLN